ncbi:helix-turn-helix domain-containing protein [Kocuria sp. WN036]|uniref:helix-turn-helix domain-containing protein n=1 Tax=Kocuria sp. WN036 TaxID=2032628 RepID=UPI0015963BAC|nr:helix-turn-helix transcriptional regulator [Kocuria sp. WN036]
MKELELGGTGQTVRENVKRLRGGMQYKALSEKLAELGHAIPPLGLRRIETGARRVTVDDLVALAVALDVSPLTLLLPADGSRFAASPLTGVPDRPVAHNVQWLWALGQEPLELASEWDDDHMRERALYSARVVPAVDERTTEGMAFIQQPDGTHKLDMSDAQAKAAMQRLFAEGKALTLLRGMSHEDREKWGLTGGAWGDAPDGDD